MHQGTRTRPATAADFHRLAERAHERGLRLFRDGPRWYCSSASDAGGCHYVTGFSCDCAGFVAHQRCTHHALLLERLGWLPELEDAAPAPIIIPGDYLDVRSCTPVVITQDGETFRAVWHEDDARETTATALIADMIGQGILSLTAVAPEASAVDCAACSGCGVVVYRSFEERCPACGGSGIRPNHHLHDAPVVPLVATIAA
jgi:hypothetical protein